MSKLALVCIHAENLFANAQASDNMTDKVISTGGGTFSFTQPEWTVEMLREAADEKIVQEE